MPSTFAIDLRGDKRLIRKFSELSIKMQRSTIRKSVRAGSTPLLREARRSAPVEIYEGRRVGVLKKNLYRRFKTDRRRGAYRAKIGARDKRVQIATTQTGRPVFRNPNKYLHLVELGTSHSAPNPFLRNARKRVQNKSIADMQSKILSDVHKEAKRA